MDQDVTIKEEDNVFILTIKMDMNILMILMSMNLVKKKCAIFVVIGVLIVAAVVAYISYS